MAFLRVVLIATTVIGLAIWGLIMVVGSGLKSWYRSGAGSEELSALAGAVGPPLIGALVLGSLFFPKARGFLHITAAAMALACAGWIWATYEDGPMIWGLAYFAGWFLYYALALQTGAASH